MDKVLKNLKEEIEQCLEKNKALKNDIKTLEDWKEAMKG